MKVEVAHKASHTAQVDVSVIIPTYHRENEVVEAVQSVFAQVGVAFEIIVVDDSLEGSAKSSIEALQDSRVTYIKRETPSGGVPALVRNQGWPLAQGKYIHFLDDDDKLYPGALSLLVYMLEKHKSKGVAFGNIVPFGSDERVLKKEKAYFDKAADRARRLKLQPLLVACMLFDATVLVNSACLIRRECLTALGGYDPAIPLWEDVEFFMRAIRKFGGLHVDKPVLLYRTGASSLSTDLHDEQQVVDSYHKIHAKYCKEHGFLEFMFLKILIRTLSKLRFFR